MTAWPEGTGRIVLDETESTNAEAMARLRAGEAAPFWVLARHQTRGRGRRGRDWLGAAGNFYGSCLLTLENDPASAALRSFGAALAVADMLGSSGVPGSRITLKWPNDVLIDGRKVAGILLESTVMGAGLSLVVGIGINLAYAPPQEALEQGAMPPVALSEVGVVIDAVRALDLLAAAFSAREAQLTSAGFGPIRDAWLAMAAHRGKTVTARLPDEAVTGVFETMDDSGALVLSTPTGRRAIHAADIYFG